MYVCRVCRGEVELDDVMLKLPSGLVVCAWCVDGQTGQRRHVSETLQREINSETPVQKIESDHETAAMTERPM